MSIMKLHHLHNLCKHFVHGLRLGNYLMLLTVISFGSQSDLPSTPYSLSGIPLQSVSSIRDLGVCLTSDLKPSTHCSSDAAMAFNRSSLLLKGFRSNAVSVLVHLYKVYVRPLLESSTQVWNPWLLKDIKCIERVQRFFTCAIYKRAGIPYMDYGNRLANLGLQSLEYRRVYYDLVMCYKIDHNLVDLSFDSFFTKPVRSYYIRGHSCILRSKCLPHHTFRAHFFTEPWSFLYPAIKMFTPSYITSTLFH